MNNDKVKISLGDKGPPIKYAKAANGRPTTTHFKCNLKMFNHLNDCVKSVSWNNVQKTVGLIIDETATLEVLKWMSYVDEQYQLSQKSPFIDMDTNNMLLVLLDEDDREVGTLKLRNLQITSHMVRLFRVEGENFKSPSIPRCLAHSIELSYQDAELIMPKTQVPFPEEKDTEWKTIEVPA